MEAFYRTHQYLLSHLSTQLVRRRLMDEINWNERLIGVKGSRGVGKTTFLLSYAKEYYGVDSRECLYINLNHFLFTARTLVDFAGEFSNNGGKTLLIDQVFKYPDWSKELRACYDNYPNLKIVFTGPAVMRLKEENPDLDGKVAVYQLRGFSFREYVNLKYDKQFSVHALADIMKDHHFIARSVVNELDHPIQNDFRSYLHHGFYPFFLENRNYSENLLKTMNMTLEVDVSHIRQIEQRYLPKLRKLLYLVSLEAPCAVNVSRLSKELEISRATVMNYIKYLKDARLLNMLYPAGENFPKKPSLLYLYNSNLMHAVNQQPIDRTTEYKTFFLNQLLKDGNIHAGSGGADFTVSRSHRFFIKADASNANNKAYYYAVNIEIGEQNIIPLWLFGFLY